MPTFPPITPRQELDGLLNAAIELAFKLISKHGSHIPFAMVVTQDGERHDIAADDSEIREPAALIAAVRREVDGRVTRGEARAVAFAQNIDYQSTEDGSKVDAIEVDLDHAAEQAVTCILPYTIDGNELQPGDLFAIEPRQTFFRGSPEGS